MSFSRRPSDSRPTSSRNLSGSRAPRPRPRRYRDHTSTLTVLMIIVALAAGGFALFQSVLVTSSHSACEVVDKDRTKDADGKSDMRIYTENCNGSDDSQVFQVKDNWFAGQFDAANTYADIEVGSSYDFETRGSRIPILSMFENVVELKEVATK